MSEKMSALDAYLNRAFKIIILLAPVAAMMSAICFTVFKIIGWYDEVSTPALIIFDTTNAIYTSIAIWLFRNCLDENGVLDRKKLMIGKKFISLVILIQWNFISYMIPANEWWSFAFFFIALAVFFFDIRMMATVSVGIVVSTAVSWIINPVNMFLGDGDHFMPDLILRIICVTLTTAVLMLLTYFGSKFLVKEIEKNYYYDKMTEKEVETLTQQMKAFKPAESTSYSQAGVVDLEIKSRNEIRDIYREIRTMQMNMIDYLNDLSMMKEDREKRESELNIASKIQADMLPVNFPKRGDIELYAMMNPAKEVGGDFYDFFFIDDDHIALVMADVSGKGVPAALFCVVTKVIIRDRVMYGGTPAEILATANNMLCENNRAGLFVTVWLGILDLKTGIVEYVNAGHEYPIVGFNDGSVSVIEQENFPPLAAMEDIEYENERIQLNPGDSLFLYTDGIPEAKSPGGSRFGMDRLVEIIKFTRDLTPEELVKGLAHEVQEYAGDNDPFDDVTIMSVLWNGK